VPPDDDAGSRFCGCGDADHELPAQPLGKILDAMGLYRFYERDLEKLGGATLHDADLARLKATIQSRYDGPRR